MNKKIVALLGVVVVGMVIVVIASRCKEVYNEGLVKASIELSKNYLGLYKGSSTFEESKFIDTEGVRVGFNTFEEELKSKDAEIYDLTNIFDTYEKIYLGEDGVTREVDLVKNRVELDFSDNSDCVVEEDGKVFAYLKDIASEDGYLASVRYGGVDLAFELETQYESYEDIQKNPNYLFNYINHNYDTVENVIDVKFRSKLDEELIKIVRCTIDKGKIVGITLK
jgi:hypothetical protein